jgi:hypothetical protein
MTELFWLLLALVFGIYTGTLSEGGRWAGSAESGEPVGHRGHRYKVTKLPDDAG